MPGPAEAVGLVEAVVGLSAARGAGLLAQGAWAELGSPGTGSMVGMGFPNLVCSFKTWNRPSPPSGPPLGPIRLPQDAGRAPWWVDGAGNVAGGSAPVPSQVPVARPWLSGITPSRRSFLLPGPNPRTCWRDHASAYSTFRDNHLRAVFWL